MSASDWDGNYESCDGQRVSDADAREFAYGLNRCYYSNYCMQIMQSVAEQIEAQIEAEGFVIPDAMRLDVSGLKDALGKLMTLSNTSGFRIV